jgi:peptidoglycan/LPS O-acetylase OafA/YrhL
MNFKPQINGLRALAVLLVLVEHSLSDAFLIKKIGPGFLGVRLFFVISGYLITGILLSAKQEAASLGWSLRQFYARRFLRIFPPYYLLLLILALVGAREYLDHWTWHTFYASNFLLVRAGDWIPLLSHFWSLAVEEQFYLVWPLLILLVPARRLPWVIGAAIVVGMASRGAMAVAGFSGVAVRSLTTSCLDILGVGALLAYVERFHPRVVPGLLRWGLVAGVGLFLPMLALRLNEGSWTIRAVFLDLSAALMFLWAIGRAAQGTLPKLLENRALAYIGQISYGIYLIHPVLPEAFEGLGRPLPELGWWHFAVLSAWTVGLASISWHLYEKPINTLKRFFPYARPARIGEAAPVPVS